MREDDVGNDGCCVEMDGDIVAGRIVAIPKMSCDFQHGRVPLVSDEKVGSCELE